QRQEDASFGADAVRHRPEQEGAGYPHELNENEGGDLCVLIDADFRTVDRGHADDRLDTVVVEEEGDEHQEGLTIAAKLMKRLPQTYQGGSHPMATPTLRRL